MRKSFLTKAIVAVGVMASAMALSSVAVFAISTSISSDSKTKTWDLTSSSLNSSITYQNLTDDTDIGGGIIAAANNSAKVVVEKGDINIKNGAVIYVPVPVNSSGSIKLVGSTNNAGRTSTVEGVTGAIAMSTSGVSGSFSSTATADGYLTITSGGDCKYSSMEITLTEGTFTTETAYSVSLSVINSSSTSVTVGLEGESITVEAGSTGTISTELVKGNYVISADNNHVLSTNQVLVTGDTSASVTVTDVKPVAEGKYTNNDIVPSNGFSEKCSTSSKYGQGEYVAFTLSNKAIVTISAKIGTSNDGKSAALSYNTSSEYNEANELFVFTAKGDEDVVTLNLDAGTYYLVGKSPVNDGDGTTTVQISSINVEYPLLTGTVDSVPAVVKSNGKYYAVVVISADAADDNQLVTINGTLETRDVYESVTLDNDYVEQKADTFATGGAYVYGIELDGCDGQTLADVQDKLSVVLTPND